MYCLIDVNNFFVSCERLFRPDLALRPVLVLSSNDGCVIARSLEVKDLGIPMGIPFFKIKPLIKKHNITCFSSNFSLYADLSRRFYKAIGADYPMEIYSIDEVFLKLPPSFLDLETFARSLRERLLQEIGLPTSLGLAPTKTLAKLALEQTTRDPKLKNVCLLTTAEDIKAALKKTPLSQVWGVGKALSKDLSSLGLTSAYDLSITSSHWIRRHFSVTLARTARELLGEECLCLEETPSPRKSLQVSRSFGTPITDLRTLHGAFSNFCEEASKKLRKSELQALGCLFFTTFRLSTFSSLTSFQKSLCFKSPLQDPRLILDRLLQEITSCFLIAEKKSASSGSIPSFHKGGLILFPLESTSFQSCLFSQKDPSDSSRTKIFQVLDTLHQKFGSHSLHLASSLGSSWKPKSTFRSPQYTTSWKELPIVYASS